MEMRLSIKPVLIMSLMVIPPEPNTIALGGVATGSIKAQDAAIAAPANKGAVSICNERLKVTNKGNTMLAVAVLEVISVRKLIDAMIMRISKYVGKKLNSLK